MRILTRENNKSKTYLLLKIENAESRAAFRQLVFRKLYREAIEFVMSRGELLVDLERDEKKVVPADIYLTEKSAHWDLT